MKTIEELVEIAKQLNASDIHLIYGLKPKFRIDGSLEDYGNEILTLEDLEDAAKWLAKDRYDEISEIGELDLSDTLCDNRCRIHIFRQQGKPSIALRILSEKIPSMERLGLPKVMQGLCNLHKGIVLITGETGSGKSTTLAAIIDKINHSRKDLIVTLEDPIEYIYTPDLCAINQREIGKDTKSFAEGLRASLREDPNVILIGEMRDKETIETAITAAETGHLVFATLHTGSAADSIERMVQSFDEGKQNQIRLQLSMTLKAVVTQQLIRGTTGGRVLATEIMIVNDAIKNYIRNANIPQIVNVIQTSRDLGGQSMDQCLIDLVKTHKISKESALYYCNDEKYIRRNI